MSQLLSKLTVTSCSFCIKCSMCPPCCCCFLYWPKRPITDFSITANLNATIEAVSVLLRCVRCAERKADKFVRRYKCGINAIRVFATAASERPIFICNVAQTCRKLVLERNILLIHRVSKKKLCQCYFLNNSVKHWPILKIFGVQHHEEN